MVVGNIAPHSGVFGVVAVVAHHPVIVFFEGVAVGNLSVDEELAVFFLQLIAFIHRNNAAVKSDAHRIQLDRGAFLRHIQGAVIVHCPVGVIDRIVGEKAA